MYYTFEGRKLELIGDGSTRNQWVPVILETGVSYSYGDFQEFKGEVTEENKKDLFIVPGNFEGSDYSGGTVQLSNHRSFLEMFKEVEGVYDLYGAYGTFGIAIRLDVSETHEEIKEVLNSLEDYGLINDEDLSQLENEQETEHMPELIKDVRRGIDLDEYVPEMDSLIEDDDKLEHLIWDGINERNLEWEHTTTGAYLSPCEVLPYVRDKLLIEYCKELPLLINWEWSCGKTHTEFEQKLKGVVSV